MKSRLALTLLCLFLCSGAIAFWMFFQAPSSRSPQAEQSAKMALSQEKEAFSSGAQASLLQPEPDALGQRPEPLAQRTEAPGEGLNAAGKAEAFEGVRVTGLVLDAGGKPLPGAEVQGGEEHMAWASSLDGTLQGERTLSDKEGRFTLTGRRPGPFRLRVLAAGFAPYSSVGWSLPRESEVQLESVQLDTGLVLGGFVFDQDRLPLAGVRVYSVVATAESFGEQELLFQASTDEHGAFRAERLPAGPWTLVAKGPDHPDGVLSGEPGAASKVLQILMPRASSLGGRVLGVPVAESNSLMVCARSVAAENPWARPQRTAPLEPSGAFVLPGVEGGVEYRLYVVRATRNSNSFPGIPVSTTVIAQGGDEGIELTFRPGATLSCQVIDAQTKQPITGLVVKAGFSFLQPLGTKLGQILKEFPDGHVRFPGLRKSLGTQACRLEIRSVGYRDYARSDISLGESEELDLGIIELEPIPFLRVTVRDHASAEPVADALVSLRRESGADPGATLMELTSSGGTLRLYGGDEIQASTGADGVAVLSSFEDQVCSLRVVAEGYAPTVLRNFHSPARRDSDFELELSPGGTVLVSVLQSDGTPVGAMRVAHVRQVEDDQDRIWRSGNREPMVTDADGQARFEFLRPGTHRFQLLQKGPVSFQFNNAPSAAPPAFSAQVLVEEGSEHALLLEAPPSAGLTGRVLESGRPLAGAALVLRVAPGEGGEQELRLNRGDYKTRSDSAGLFQFDGLEVGNYEVSVEHSTRDMAALFALNVVEGSNQAELELGLTQVEGHVLSSTGDPIEGVRVRALLAESDGEPEMEEFYLSSTGELGVLSSTKGLADPRLTDEAGYFRLRGLPAGVELVLVADGTTVQTLRTDSFVLGLDELRSTPDLIVDEGGALRFEVLLEDKYAPLVRLTAIWIGGEESVTPISSLVQNGRGRLDGLRPGKWQLQLNTLALGQGVRSGSLGVEVEISAGQELFRELRLELK